MTYVPVKMCIEVYAIVSAINSIAAQCGAQGANYFILLILTDGIITDMPQTCEAIVNVWNTLLF